MQNKINTYEEIRNYFVNKNRYVSDLNNPEIEFIYVFNDKNIDIYDIQDDYLCFSINKLGFNIYPILIPISKINSMVEKPKTNEGLVPINIEIEKANYDEFFKELKIFVNIKNCNLHDKLQCKDLYDFLEKSGLFLIKKIFNGKTLYLFRKHFPENFECLENLISHWIAKKS